MYPEKPIRYDKNSLVYVNGKEYTLISFLSEKRQERKITKKFISNIIKQNDNWYSQIEMGKVDNNRKRFIKRPDLINIISVIIYGAINDLDLERYANEAANYIDIIMNVTPFDQSPRQIPIYEMMKHVEKICTSEYTNNRIDEYLSVFNEITKEFYQKCNITEKNAVINFLSALILNMQKEPIMTLHYCSLPFFVMFDVHPQNEDCKKIVEKEIVKDVDTLLLKYSRLLQGNDICSIVENILKCLDCTNIFNENTFKYISNIREINNSEE